MKFFLDTFERKPDNLALTEKWKTEAHDSETCNLNDHHPIEANHMKIAERRSTGVAFHIKTSLHFGLSNYNTNNECSASEV